MIIKYLVFLLVFLPLHAIADTEPTLKWEFNTKKYLAQAVIEDQLNKSFVYIAQKEGGVLVLDANLTEKKVSLIPKSKLGNLDAMNLAQQGKFLYVALGDLFKLWKI